MHISGKLLLELQISCWSACWKMASCPFPACLSCPRCNTSISLYGSLWGRFTAHFIIVKAHCLFGFIQWYRNNGYWTCSCKLFAQIILLWVSRGKLSRSSRHIKVNVSFSEPSASLLSLCTVEMQWIDISSTICILPKNNTSTWHLPGHNDHINRKKTRQHITVM